MEGLAFERKRRQLGHPLRLHWGSGNAQSLRDEPQKRGVKLHSEVVKFYKATGAWRGFQVFFHGSSSSLCWVSKPFWDPIFGVGAPPMLVYFKTVLGSHFGWDW